MMKRTHWSLMIAAGLLTLAVSGCGSSSPTGPSMAGQVTISGFAFSALTVSVNTTVTWMNGDSVTHTATADSGSAFQFDTGSISAGATSQGIKFSQVGTFAYHCNVHPTMHGTIVVQ